MITEVHSLDQYQLHNGTFLNYQVIIDKTPACKFTYTVAYPLDQVTVLMS